VDGARALDASQGGVFFRSGASDSSPDIQAGTAF
jgi:hypothetical protein